MTRHSPHRAIRPSAYLFEPCVFLRDFPHRAVDFLTGEMCLRLHDDPEKAKLGKKLLVACHLSGRQGETPLKYDTMHNAPHFRYVF